VQSDLFIQLFQHSTQNHWVCGPWPSFEIWSNWERLRFGNWICFSLQMRGGRHVRGGINFRDWCCHLCNSCAMQR
jgi:hypothetical protein